MRKESSPAISIRSAVSASNRAIARFSIYRLIVAAAFRSPCGFCSLGFRLSLLALRGLTRRLRGLGLLLRDTNFLGDYSRFFGRLGPLGGDPRAFGFGGPGLVSRLFLGGQSRVLRGLVPCGLVLDGFGGGKRLLLFGFARLRRPRFLFRARFLGGDACIFGRLGLSRQSGPLSFSGADAPSVLGSDASRHARAPSDGRPIVHRNAVAPNDHPPTRDARRPNSSTRRSK